MTVKNPRNMVFISHAWEDYEFVKWLALKLAKEGYGVWCDVTKLLGGQNWPKEINDALQNRTCKFLFVLSRDSNTKQDPLGELETSRKIMKREALRNFIIPLKIDGILRDEVDYRLQEIQTVSFEGSWAEGLANLLNIFQEENVPTHESFTPEAVNDWWKNYGTNCSKIVNVSEDLSSNRFKILSYPETLCAHFVNEKPILRGLVRYPVVPHKEYILSFAGSEELKNEAGVRSQIVESVPFSTKEILEGNDELIKDSKTGTYYFVRLMNQAFDRGLLSKGLESYRLSRGFCYYFHQGVLSDGRIKYRNGEELNPRIKLWGKHKDNTWHWGLRGRMYFEPEIHYQVQFHVLTRDGNKTRPAPKRVYKSWRNATLRDRLKASLIHLAGDTPMINFNVGGETLLGVSSMSTMYKAQISYEEPSEKSEGEEFIADE